MKTTLYSLIMLFVALTLPFAQKTSDALTNAWNDWLDRQTDWIVVDALEKWQERDLIAELDERMLTSIRSGIRAQLKTQITKTKKKYASPYDMNRYEITAIIENTGPRKHFGPQTVDALMESFHEEYSTVRQYIYGEAHLKELDAKYPPDEWIQMLLDKEVAITDNDFYTRFLSMRESVVNLENKPEEWTSGKHGISSTNDFRTYRDAFVNRKIWEYQQIRAAFLTDPNIRGGFFGGPETQTFFPYKSGRVYVRRDGDKFAFLGEKLSRRQQFELLSKGITPEGHEIIYLDENSNLLDKPPVPISPEALLETGIPGPPWDEIAPNGRASKTPSEKTTTSEHFQVRVEHPDRLITPISRIWETRITREVKNQIQDPRPVFEVPPRDDR